MKKSQVRMLETIIVLAVFSILIILVIGFYSRTIGEDIEIERDESLQLNAIRIVGIVTSLPELQCSKDNIIVDNCVDLLKLAVLPRIIKENEIHYFDILSFSRISVQEAYPGNKELMVIYDRPLEEYSNKIAINLPVSLYDSLNDEYSLGVITLEVFS